MSDSSRGQQKIEIFMRLARLGITSADAIALRRAAVTLSNWFAEECGGSNILCSYAIERDAATNIPYRKVYYYREKREYRIKIADRETGARKRIEKIMARYPNLVHYIHTDPRGASLHLLQRADVAGADLSSVYSRGVAIW